MSKKTQSWEYFNSLNYVFFPTNNNKHTFESSNKKKFSSNDYTTEHDDNSLDNVNLEDLCTPLNRKQDVCNLNEKKTKILETKFSRHFSVSEYFMFININGRKLRVE